MFRKLDKAGHLCPLGLPMSPRRPDLVAVIPQTFPEYEIHATSDLPPSENVVWLFVWVVLLELLFELLGCFPFNIKLCSSSLYSFFIFPTLYRMCPLKLLGVIPSFSKVKVEPQLFLVLAFFILKDSRRRYTNFSWDHGFGAICDAIWGLSGGALRTQLVGP